MVGAALVVGASTARASRYHGVVHDEGAISAVDVGNIDVNGEHVGVGVTGRLRNRILRNVIEQIVHLRIATKSQLNRPRRSAMEDSFSNHQSVQTRRESRVWMSSSSKSSTWALARTNWKGKYRAQ